MGYITPQQDLITRQTLTTPQSATTVQKQKQTVVNKPKIEQVQLNNPLQLNSIWDVLFNSAGLKAQYGENTVGSRFKAAWDIFKKQYWNPMTTGDFKTAGLNTLLTLGETLDVGNIIKALLPGIDRTADIDYDEALQAISAIQDGQCWEYVDSFGVKQYDVMVNGMNKHLTEEDYDTYCNVVNSGRSVNIKELTTGERVAAAIGFGKYGRINYNADTGNLVGDIILELALDPTTWLSLGATTGVKNATKEVATNLAETLGEQGAKRTAATAMRFWRNGKVIAANNDPLNRMLKNMLGDAVKTNKMYNTYAISNIKDALSVALAKADLPGGSITSAALRDLMIQGADTYVNRTAFSALKVLDTANNINDRIQSALLKLTISPTGIYPLVHIAKKSPAAAAWAKNLLTTGAKPYVNEFGNRTILSYTDSAINDLRVNRAIRSSLPDDLKASYIAPNRIREHEIQLLNDEAWYASWWTSFTEDNADEAVAKLREYVSKAQSTTDETITLEDFVARLDKFIADTDINSAIVKKYAKDMHDILNFVQEVEKRSALSKRWKALQNGYETLRVKSLDIHAPEIMQGVKAGKRSVGLTDIFINSIPEAAAHSPGVDGLPVVTPQQLINNLAIHNQQYIQNISVYLDDVINAYPAATARSDSLVAKLNKILSDDTKKIVTKYLKITEGEDELFSESILDMYTEVHMHDLRKEISAAIDSWYSDVYKKTIDFSFNTKYRKVELAQLVGPIELLKPLTVPEQILEAQKAAHSIFTDVYDTMADIAKKSGEIDLSSGFTYISQNEELYTQTIELVEALQNYVAVYKNTANEKFGIAYGTHGKVSTYDPAQILDDLNEMFSLPKESEEYAAAYNNVTRYLSDSITVLQQGAQYKDIRTELLPQVQNVLNSLQQTAAPHTLDETVCSMAGLEDYVHFKLENATMLQSLLSNPNISKLVQHMQDAQTQLFINQLLDGALELTEEGKRTVKYLQDVCTSYIAVNRFMCHLNSDTLDAATKAGVLSSVVKQYRTTAGMAMEHTQQFIDDVIEQAENYINYTFLGNRKRSLDMLSKKDSEFRHYIEQVFADVEETVPEEELHTVLSDSRINFGVALGLAEKDPELKARITQGRVIVYDTEAMNLSTSGLGNEIHQFGFTVYDSGKEVGHYAVSVSPEYLNYTNIPDTEYIEKILGRDYVSTHSRSECAAKYAEHLLQGNSVDAVASPDAVLVEGMRALNNAVAEYGVLDEATGNYTGVTLLGHNIKKFDDPLMQDTIKNHELYNTVPEADVFNRVGDHVDTFDLIKKADELFEMPEDDKTKVINMLTEYVKDMSDAPDMRVFTVLNPQELSTLDAFSKEMKNINDPRYVAMGELIANDVHDAVTVLRDISDTNDALSQISFPKALIESDSVADVWYTRFKKMGLSDEEITRRFGKDANNVTMSALMGLQGDIPAYAYRNTLKKATVNRWFTGVDEAIKTGKIKDVQIQKLTDIANMFSRTAENVYDLERFCNPALADAYQNIIDKCMALSDFKFLASYLRTQELNKVDQYVLARYFYRSLAKSGRADDLLKEFTAELQLQLKSTLQKAAKRTDCGKYKDLYAYNEVVNSTLDLRASLNDISEYADNKCISDSTSIRARAMDPVLRALKDFSNSAADDQAVYMLEKECFDNITVAQTRLVWDMDFDGMVRWIAGNYGRPIVLDKMNIAKLGNGATAYDDFLTKLASEEFAGANIRFVEHEDGVVIYLAKEADLQVYFKNGAPEFHVNGIQIEPDYPILSWESVQDVYRNRCELSDIDEAINALDGISGKNMRGSCWDSINRDAFEKFWRTLPQETQAAATPFATMDSPLAWNGPQFNRTFLGSGAMRKRNGVISSERPLSMLANATNYATECGAAKDAYVQSMLTDFTSVRKTNFGAVMRDEPHSVASYLKKNPDYTFGVLLEDTKHSQKYKFEIIDGTTVAGVKRAYALNAHIMSYSEANKYYEVINEGLFSETKIRAWQTLVRFYKIGYLANPGTWMRNAYDAFIKNVGQTGNDAPAMVKRTAIAMHDLSEYDDICKTLNNLGQGHRPKPAEIQAWFTDRAGMTYERFKMIDSFQSSAEAGSEALVFSKLNTKARKRYAEQLAAAGAITTDELRKQQFRLSCNQITNTLLNPMNYVERVNRFALFDELTSRGHNTTSALHAVDRTHFSYSVKSNTEQVLELMLPFYTFANRNLNYWIDEIDRNPAYFSMMRDVLAPTLDLDEYSENERTENNSVNRLLMGANWNATGDYYVNLNMSTFDALKWLTNPLEQGLSSVFSPIQGVIEAFLQETADTAYENGSDTLSQFLQETFNLKMTEQEVADKYGEWAATYKELYDFRISKRGIADDIFTTKMLWQIIPLIGSQIQKLQSTGIYINDQDYLGAVLAFSGIGGKTTRWESSGISKPYNQAIYSIISGNAAAMTAYTNIKKALGLTGVKLKDIPLDAKRRILEILQSDDMTNIYNSELYQAAGTNIYNLLQADERNVTLYNQLKGVMGYGDAHLSDIPDDVKQAIYAIMMHETPVQNVVPVLANAEAMQYIWTSVSRRHDMLNVPVEEIPQDTLNEMYATVAEDAIVLADIYKMLSEDEGTRYTYAVAKNKLGFKNLKLYQIPVEALQVIQTAMQNNYYGSAPAGGTKSTGQRKTYKSRNKARYVKDFTNLYYDSDKAKWSSYSHNSVAKIKQYEYQNFYTSNYSKNGSSRVALQMLNNGHRQLDPTSLKFARQNMKYNFR